jgi:hypothetical protein
MSFEFKEGDIVKIEGVVEKSYSEKYPLKVHYTNRGDNLSFTVDGKFRVGDEHAILQLVSRPKRFVTKWNWVYSNGFNKLSITTNKYSTEKEMYDYMGLIPIQKIDSTAEEMEVSDV